MGTETKNDLITFDWEDDGVDMFGINTETKTKEEEGKEKEKVATKTKEQEEEEEVTFETFTETPAAIETTAASTEEGNDEVSIYKDLFLDSKKAGIFKHVEIEEEEEIDADRFAELQEQEYETEVSERLKTWATEELDEDAKAFISFKRKGGNTEDFFKTYQSALDIPTGDISDEDYQDRVIRYSLTKEGWDKDEIEDRIQYLSDNGRKEKFAKKYDDKLKEDSEAQKQAVLKQAEINTKAVKAQEETFKNSIKEFLEDTDELEGFKVTSADKKELYNFLTRKEFKVSDTKSITGFQQKLAEVFQDTNKLVLLAKLISKDFDMSDFEKKTKTKQTREIKTNLEQRKNLRPSNSGSSLQGTSLADLF